MVSNLEDMEHPDNSMVRALHPDSTVIPSQPTGNSSRTASSMVNNLQHTDSNTVQALRQGNTVTANQQVNSSTGKRMASNSLTGSNLTHRRRRIKTSTTSTAKTLRTADSSRILRLPSTDRASMGNSQAMEDTSRVMASSNPGSTRLMLLLASSRVVTVGTLGISRTPRRRRTRDGECWAGSSTMVYGCMMDGLRSMRSIA